jgi:DNA mismatch endonuclease (patch repair protein)
MLFPKHRAAVFVHGCFWHGHDCPLFKVPSTRQEFWLQKIATNRKRDATVSEQIESLHWRELVIWECAIRGPQKIGLEQTVEKTVTWLRSESPRDEIRSLQMKAGTA